MTAPPASEDRVIGLVAGDLGLLQMRGRAAHGRGVVDSGDLDAGLVELRERGHRRARLHDVGRVGHIVDWAERHFRHPLGVLRQERDVPGAAGGRVGDLAGVRIGHIGDGHAELGGHRLAEVDRHAGVDVTRLGRPVRAAGGTDAERHPQRSGGSDLAFQRIGVGRSDRGVAAMPTRPRRCDASYCDQPEGERGRCDLHSFLLASARLAARPTGRPAASRSYATTDTVLFGHDPYRPTAGAAGSQSGRFACPVCESLIK
jgi:hypothetical protein